MVVVDEKEERTSSDSTFIGIYLARPSVSNLNTQSRDLWEPFFKFDSPENSCQFTDM